MATTTGTSIGTTELAKSVRSPSLLARKHVKNTMWVTSITIFIAAGGLVLLFPVAFMLSTSLKPTSIVFLLPMKWLPYLQFRADWNNYPQSLAFMGWITVYGNTLKVAINNMFADVISGAVVAYGFARFRARGKDVLFALLISTLMIPYVTRLVPEFLLFSRLGMVNTLLPLIIPPWFGSAFNIFLLRQFMMTIPREMDDAAKVDGAGPVGIFVYVLLPQIRAALAVVAITSLTFNWNDFLRPLIYLNSHSVQTAAIALANFQADYGGTPYNQLMAATVVNLIPVVILFFVAQRYFIQGIVISGVKG